MNKVPVPGSKTLEAYLSEANAAPALQHLILTLMRSCAEISAVVRRGALSEVLGATEDENVQGEVQKKLDVISNDMLIAAARESGVVGAGASEELEDIFVLAKDGPYLLLFDPLDGSSNIDINVSIGTILSILPRPDMSREVVESDFMQCGRSQVAAAYTLYGPQTTLTLTLGDGVVGFTLDPQSQRWLLTEPQLTVKETANEFAINMSNQRHWADPIRSYIGECLEGKSGPRGKDFNMRWVGAMVADVHRILSRGGVFLYPWDAREPHRAGKLRLMYEANPLGYIIEQAGGAATDGREVILDIQPSDLHQRVSVVLGAREEVNLVVSKHNQAASAA